MGLARPQRFAVDPRYGGDVAHRALLDGTGPLAGRRELRPAPGLPAAAVRGRSRARAVRGANRRAHPPRGRPHLHGELLERAPGNALASGRTARLTSAIVGRQIMPAADESGLLTSATRAIGPGGGDESRAPRVREQSRLDLLAEEFGLVHARIRDT